MGSPDGLEQALGRAFGDAEDTPPPTEADQPEPDAAPPEAEPADAAAPAEDEVADEETPAVSDEEQRLYAGKYTSIEELEAGYKAIESKLGDGDYRALKDEHDRLAAQLDELQADVRTAPTPPPTATPDWLDEDAFENPVQARELALWTAAQQPWVFEKAMGVWYDVDPRAASAFEREVERAQWEAEHKERVEAPLQQLTEQQAAAAQQQQVEAAFESAWTNTAARNPDLGEYTDKIMEQARSAPAILSVFEGTDTAAMEGTLNLLLSAARERRAHAEQLSGAQEQEAALAAKRRGQATRATSTAGSQAQPPPGPADRFLEIFDEVAGFSEER